MKSTPEQKQCDKIIFQGINVLEKWQTQEMQLYLKMYGIIWCKSSFFKFDLINTFVLKTTHY
jgi:hypothetical protein